ncbi:MAG TPA: AAA domain-containing protein [Candidatus Obscuribacterales bacterium]
MKGRQYGRRGGGSGHRVPVIDSFAGIKRALDDELRSMRPISFDVLKVDADQRHHAITLSPGSRVRLKEDYEGWSVAGEKLESGVYPWVGEVVSVDVEHNVLVVVQLTGDSSPRDSHRIFLYEPDYQRATRDWSEERHQKGARLPDLYLKICSGEVQRSPGTLDPALHLSPSVPLRARQKIAVAASGRPVSLVWGPPGTGKTFTLGYAAACLSLAGRKVMVVAPTNSATDQAALAIDDAMCTLGSPLSLGQLIRPGRPQLAELERRKHLMAWTAMLKKASDEILALREEIKKVERARLSSSEPERTALNHELARLKQELKNVEVNRAANLWELAFEARIIVTTTTAALHHPEILASFAEQESALLLDEASMIPRYLLARLAEIAPSQLAVFGDVRQLGPIRRNQSPTDANSIFWVADSVFDAFGAGDDNTLEALEQAGCLVMLNEQSRMNERLCVPISRSFYRGRLTTVGTHELPPLLPGWPQTGVATANPLFFPVPKSAPALGFESQPDFREKRYEHSAWVALGIAESLLRDAPTRSILLVSPFRNQADLLRKLVRAHLSHFPRVSAGTVHVCQGQEAELVIFDPVLPRHPWLLGSFGEKEMKSLFCVAFSRAKVQVIVMGCREELLSNPLLDLMCRDSEEWIPGRRVEP